MTRGGGALTASGGLLLPVLASVPVRPGKRRSGRHRRHRRPVFDLVGIGMVVTVVWAGSFVLAIGTGNGATFGQATPVMLVVAGGLFAGGIRREE